jgi:hypothetical protein
MYWYDNLLIGHKEDIHFYLYNECWFYWALGVSSRTMPDIFKIILIIPFTYIGILLTLERRLFDTS